jgi:hypothetical protein
MSASAVAAATMQRPIGQASMSLWECEDAELAGSTRTNTSTYTLDDDSSDLPVGELDTDSEAESEEETQSDDSDYSATEVIGIDAYDHDESTIAAHVDVDTVDVHVDILFPEKLHEAHLGLNYYYVRPP